MNTARELPLTIDDANRRLPLIRLIVTDIVRLASDLDARRTRLESVRNRVGTKRTRENVYSEELEDIEQGIETDEDQLRGFISELEELGAELRDPLQGRVDFPTLIDGEDAYFCWQFNEDEILRWRWMSSADEIEYDLLENAGHCDEPSGTHQPDTSPPAEDRHDTD